MLAQSAPRSLAAFPPEMVQSHLCDSVTVPIPIPPHRNSPSLSAALLTILCLAIRIWIKHRWGPGVLPKRLMHGGNAELPRTYSLKRIEAHGVSQPSPTSRPRAFRASGSSRNGCSWNRRCESVADEQERTVEPSWPRTSNWNRPMESSASCLFPIKIAARPVRGQVIESRKRESCKFRSVAKARLDSRSSESRPASSALIRGSTLRASSAKNWCDTSS